MLLNKTYFSNLIWFLFGSSDLGSSHITNHFKLLFYQSRVVFSTYKVILVFTGMLIILFIGVTDASQSQSNTFQNLSYVFIQVASSQQHIRKTVGRFRIHISTCFPSTILSLRFKNSNSFSLATCIVNLIFPVLSKLMR